MHLFFVGFMSLFFSTVDTAYFQTIPKDVKISFHTDIGNDPDDAISLYLVLEAMQNNQLPKNALIEIITTIFDPLQKASIAAKISSFMRFNEIPIYSGYGNKPKTSYEFIKVYPFWPSQWGIPGFTNKVSHGQAKSFSKLPFSTSQISNQSTSFAIQQSLLKYGQNEVILGLAPLTDLANVLQDSNQVNRIIMMGGFYENNSRKGEWKIARLGYNLAVDPVAAKKILTQTTHPVLIFNTQQVVDWDITLTPKEIFLLLNSNEKNLLGEAIGENIAYYWSNKLPMPFGNLSLADVLTVYVGLLHPELIKTTVPIEFHFDLVKNPMASVMKKEKSNIHIVTELTIDRETLKNDLLKKIAVPLFFRDHESFVEAKNDQI